MKALNQAVRRETKAVTLPSPVLELEEREGLSNSGSGSPACARLSKSQYPWTDVFALVCFSNLLVLPVLQWGWKTCVTVNLTLCILCLRQQRVELAVHFPHASLSPQVPLHRFQRLLIFHNIYTIPRVQISFGALRWNKESNITWWFFTCFHYIYK